MLHLTILRQYRRCTYQSWLLLILNYFIQIAYFRTKLTRNVPNPPLPVAVSALYHFSKADNLHPILNRVGEVSARDRGSELFDFPDSQQDFFVSKAVY